ncbi:MAG: BatA domain-containing protein [Methanosarcinales archaeon]|nr:BatA domain-containing protein [Methanosarcinales archaeon]
MAIPDILLSNPLGLLALASIIPLIILYLLRPKTMNMNVPSFLFFLKRRQQRNKLSLLLQKIIRDPMFLIQLLILLLLSTAIAAPYIMEERVSGQHTVIVIDNSASMQAGGRLDTAKELAAGRLSTVNSVVWAQNVPVMALKEADRTNAAEIIDLTPQRAVTSDLAAATTYAKRLAGPGGTIIVFSDFASWSGDDPLVAKGLAEQDGVRVEFVQVAEASGNIGIVNGWLDVEQGDYTLNLAIRNFDDKKKTVAFDVRTGSDKRSGSLSIPAHSTRAYIVPDLQTGITKVSISNGGALSLDDTAYLYIPSAAGGRVLLVDSRNEPPTGIALSLLPVSVRHTTTLPGNLSDYGVVILGSVDNNSLGPNAAKALGNFVKSGGTLIATASVGSMGLANLDSSLLPIDIIGMSNETDLKMISESPLTSSIPLSDIEVVRHIRGTAPDTATVLMEGLDGAPMLSHWRRGEGTVIYLGLNDITGDDAWSGFNTMPQFPLFWKQMLDWTGGTYVDEYNVRTGSVLRLPAQQTITNPDGTTQTTSNLWVDQSGLYYIGEQVMAANLYDAEESDVDHISIDASSTSSRYTERPEVIRSEVKKDLSPYIIWMVLGLLLLELIIILRRRELF